MASWKSYAPLWWQSLHPSSNVDENDGSGSTALSDFDALVNEAWNKSRKSSEPMSLLANLQDIPAAPSFRGDPRRPIYPFLNIPGVPLWANSSNARPPLANNFVANSPRLGSSSNPLLPVSGLPGQPIWPDPAARPVEQVAPSPHWPRSSSFGRFNQSTWLEPTGLPVRSDERDPVPGTPATRLTVGQSDDDYARPMQVWGRMAEAAPIGASGPQLGSGVPAMPADDDPFTRAAERLRNSVLSNIRGRTLRGITTPAHEDLKYEASHYTPSSMNFGFLDVAKWKTDPEYIKLFKDQFVHENRDLIKAAAKKYDLPEELLAGVAHIEIGGADPLKDPIYALRTAFPYFRYALPSPRAEQWYRDKTSLGQQAMQPRRAAETLGYDPKTLTEAQRAELVKSLRDPAQSIFLAARHLNDLRNVDFPGKDARNLTPDDIKVIGARYNFGPETPIGNLKLSYGSTIVRDWTKLGNLLNNAPKKLEYSPIKNNFRRP